MSATSPATEEELETKRELYQLVIPRDTKGEAYGQVTHKSGQFYITFKDATAQEALRKDRSDFFDSRTSRQEGLTLTINLAQSIPNQIGQDTPISELEIFERDLNTVMSMPNGKNTLLLNAAKDGYARATKYLLENKADLNHKDAAGNTALHLAAQASHENVAAVLLAQPKINLFAKNKAGKTALDIAAETATNPFEEEQPKIVKAITEALGRQLLQCISSSASTTYSTEVDSFVESLKDCPVKEAVLNFAGPDGTALHLAAQQANTHNTAFLLSQAEIAPWILHNNQTALQVAKKDNAGLIIAHVIDKLTAPSIAATENPEKLLRLNKLLFESTKHELDDLSKKLIIAGANNLYKDSEDGTALHLAAKAGNAEITESLLATKDPALTVKDSLGKTALDVATGDARDAIKRNIINTLFTALLLNPGNSSDRKKALEVALSATTDTKTKQDLLKYTSDGNRPLHLAAAKNDTALVQIMLDNGANTRATNAEGQTAIELATTEPTKTLLQEYQADLDKKLLVAVKNTTLDTKTVIELLGKGADPNAIDAAAQGLEKGYSAMHYIAQKGDTALAQAALKYAEDPNLASSALTTPLHVAARYGNEAVIVVLATKANPTLKDSLGRTARDVAVLFEKQSAMTALSASATAAPPPTLDQLIEPAREKVAEYEVAKDVLGEAEEDFKDATKDHADTIRLATKLAGDAAKRNAQAIDEARILQQTSEAEYKEAEQKLIALRLPAIQAQFLLDVADNLEINQKVLQKVLKKIPNPEYNTALFLAVEQGKSKSLKSLLFSTLDVTKMKNAAGESLMQAAIRSQHTASFDALVKADKGLEPTKDGKTPMHMAAEVGNEHALKYLIQHANNDLNPCDYNGRTPLHLAAASPNSATMVKMLLKAGADFRAVDKYGLTPLQLADSSNNKDVVTALVAAGADDITGESNLDRAILQKSAVEAQKLLVKQFPREKENQDLLIYAAAFNKTAVAEHVLGNGLYQGQVSKDSNGKTALYYAAEHGNSGLAEQIMAKAIAYETLLALLSEKCGDMEGTVLHAAAWSGDVATLEILLKAGADRALTDNKGQNPLDIAIRYGRIDAVRFLKEQKLTATQPTESIASLEDQSAREEMATILGVGISAVETLRASRRASVAGAHLPPGASTQTAGQAGGETSLPPPPQFIGAEPVAIEYAKLSAELKAKVDAFVDKGKLFLTPEHWPEKKYPSQEVLNAEVIAHKQASSLLVKELKAHNMLHDCEEGVHEATPKPVGKRKIFEIDTKKLKGKRIFMPRILPNGSNERRDNGELVMDVLCFGADGKVEKGCIAPPPEHSTISDDLINQLRAVHQREAGITQTPAPAPLYPPVGGPAAGHDGPKVPDPAILAAIIAQAAKQSAAGHTGGPPSSHRFGRVLGPP